MSDDMVSMKIDENIVKECVKKQIEQAIVRELGNVEEYMANLISLALNHKVDENGKFTTASYEKRTYLEYLFNKTITDTAKKAFEEYMNTQSKEFKKQFKAYFKTQEVKKKVNDALLKFALKQVDNISSKISISFDRNYNV